MSAHETTISHEHHEEHASMTKSLIWKVFFILLGVTLVEFFIALYALPHHWFSQEIANFVYIALTIVKAAYIVAYFMHLKFEKIGLIIGVVLPIVFLVYFVALMIIEGNHLLFSIK
ncbi:cytochrome C oxidase subunit IV family protein [Solitalea sp. MAHUQ-68]|uniref:Cytochrome C oxidase subunit IV family protein n=1 Tax=Solitalea agri TaxID=2953739 RepID=A0A9X2FAP1_9SPHI|nr:cytochrome C oxidase subunit IV family protein [Solitalea agri]MCO4293458.1 cytochrome C oxidase subunit IV family protein [Solitalea agri]